MDAFDKECPRCFGTGIVAGVAPPVAMPVAPLPASTPAAPQYPPGSMICETCGHIGLPVKYSQFNILLALVLLCCWLFPGVVYCIWAASTEYTGCALCKGRVLIPLLSPRGMDTMNRVHNQP